MTKEPLEKDRSLHHPDHSVLRTKALAKYLAASPRKKPVGTDIYTLTDFFRGQNLTGTSMNRLINFVAISQVRHEQQLLFQNLKKLLPRQKRKSKTEVETHPFFRIVGVLYGDRRANSTPPLIPAVSILLWGFFGREIFGEGGRRSVDGIDLVTLLVSR